MDNSQIPPMQIQPNPMGQGYSVPPNGMPMVQQVQVMPEEKRDVGGLIKTIVIIILSLISITFIGLFIWMMMQFNEVQTDVQGQIDAAVMVAKDEQAQKDEEEFAEREKYPLKSFFGPVDYGELSFEYPKTWSVYVEAAATTGGDFKAYFNPNQVDAVSAETINALRVIIRNKSFEDVTAEYQRSVEREDANLSVESITVNGAAANRYTGVIPGTKLEGVIVIFKIRDKTAILQTDSSQFFGTDFDALVNTVKFNA